MEFRSAVSFVQAARSTLRMTEGAITAARMAMTPNTPIISIKVNPQCSRLAERDNDGSRGLEPTDCGQTYDPASRSDG